MIFEDFKPVVEPRMNVRLVGANNKIYGYYRVKGVEPIGQFVKDFGKTISAESTSSGIEFEEVYMDDNTFAQWRIWVLDDVEIKLNLIGRTETRGTTKYEISTAYSFSMDTNGHDGMSQFFTFEDEKVYVDVHNPTKSSISSERVLLMGYKYTLDKLDGEPEKYTDIPISKIA